MIIFEHPNIYLHISDVYETGSNDRTTKRKILKLENENEQIEIKLWNEKSEMEIPIKGTEVIINTVIVDEHHGKKSLNSTQFTTIQVCN